MTGNVHLADWQSPTLIRSLLAGAKTVAIVGLSPKPLRASYFVGLYLQRNGYRIVPVNPRETEILGERSWPDLASIPGPVDLVDVFRAPSATPEIVEQAAGRTRALWLQYGVIHEEAARRARALGIEVVMDRCVKVEHARHFGRLHWLGFATGRISARRSRPTGGGGTAAIGPDTGTAPPGDACEIPDARPGRSG